MAEILVFVTDEQRPNHQPQDGDILFAASDRLIATAHAGRTTWPWSDAELRHFLVLRIEDFDLALEGRLPNQEWSWLENMSGYREGIDPVLNRYSRARVDWRSLDLGVSVSDVLDRSKRIEPPKLVVPISAVEYKPRLTLWSSEDRAKHERGETNRIFDGA